MSDLKEGEIRIETKFSAGNAVAHSFLRSLAVPRKKKDGTLEDPPAFLVQTSKGFSEYHVSRVTLFAVPQGERHQRKIEATVLAVRTK